jgi:hypothetical protein
MGFLHHQGVMPCTAECGARYEWKIHVSAICSAWKLKVKSLAAFGQQPLEQISGCPVPGIPVSQEHAMAKSRANREPTADKRVNFGAWGVVSIASLFLTLLFGLLFASGYWNESAKRADSTPQFYVKVVGGRLPGVVVEPIRAGTVTMTLPVDPPSADVNRGFAKPAKTMTR